LENKGAEQVLPGEMILVMGEEVGKEYVRVRLVQMCTHVNGKMRPVETLSRRGEEGKKENSRGG
jgi:hypothetical protein